MYKTYSKSTKPQVYAKTYAKRRKPEQREHRRKESGWMDTAYKYGRKYAPKLWEYAKHYAKKWLPWSQRTTIPTTGMRGTRAVRASSNGTPRFYARRQRPLSKPPIRKISTYGTNVSSNTRKLMYAKSIIKTKPKAKSIGQYYHQITDQSQLRPTDQTISFDGEIFAIREIGADSKRYQARYGPLSPYNTIQNINAQQGLIIGTGEANRIGTNIKISSYKVKFFIIPGTVPVPDKIGIVLWVDRAPQGIDNPLMLTPSQPATPGGPYDTIATASDLFLQHRNSTNMSKYDILDIKHIDIHTQRDGGTTYGLYSPHIVEFSFTPDHTCSYTTSTGLIADCAEWLYKVSFFSYTNSQTSTVVYVYYDIHYRDA